MKKWSNSNRRVIIEQSSDMISEKRPKLVTGTSTKPHLFIYPRDISETSKLIYIPDTNIMLKLIEDVLGDRKQNDRIDLEGLVKMVHQKQMELVSNILKEKGLKTDEVFIYLSSIMWGEVVYNSSHSLAKGILPHLATLYRVNDSYGRLKNFGRILDERDRKSLEEILNLYMFIGMISPGIIHLPHLDERRDYYRDSRMKSTYRRIQIEHAKSYNKIPGRKEDWLGLDEFMGSDFDTYLILLIGLRKILAELSSLNSSDYVFKFGKEVVRKFVDKSDTWQMVDTDSNDGYYKIIHDQYDEKKTRIYPSFLFRYPILIATYDGPLYKFLSSVSSSK
ncbi:MAG: hypothetical protein QXH89_02235 [Candidatus Anstonellales archaeon]